MGWAHYDGDLTDVSTRDDVFEGARATAVMIGMEGSSYFGSVSAASKSASGKAYSTHLHEGPCVGGDGAAAGGHYNTQKEARPLTLADERQTEVHLDFPGNSDGFARTTVNVPFVPKPGVRSIVIH